MDLELSQLDRVYLKDLASYNRIINQRNKLLKDAYFQNDLIDKIRNKISKEIIEEFTP